MDSDLLAEARFENIIYAGEAYLLTRLRKKRDGRSNCVTR